MPAVYLHLPEYIPDHIMETVLVTYSSVKQFYKLDLKVYISAMHTNLPSNLFKFRVGINISYDAQGIDPPHLND